MDTDSTGVEAIDREFTRRDYLIYQAVIHGTDAVLATDRVDGWGIANPEYDMDEKMTWAQWQDRDDDAVASDMLPVIAAVAEDEDQR